MALKQVYILSLLLALLKLGGFFASGSLIVLASFYDSLSDALISYFNYFFYKAAREKADPEHPFGHGGFEVISSMIQGILIAVLALLIMNSAVNKLLWTRGDEYSPQAFPWAIGIMIVSAFSGFVLQNILKRYEQTLAKSREQSLTISADRTHYMADFWTNGLGVLGLIIVMIFKDQRLDSIFALIASVFILKSAYPLLKNSFLHIMQSGAEVEVQKSIVTLVLSCDPKVRGVHRLRTRRLGPTLFIDFHLKLPAKISLHEAHELGDRVEAMVKQHYPSSDVLVHLDPDDIPDEEELPLRES